VMRFTPISISRMGVMKEGLIVYLVGGQEIPEPFDLNRNCRQLGLPAHQVELVGKSQGFFSVTCPRCCSTAYA
jgi:hypothetical protein